MSEGVKAEGFTHREPQEKELVEAAISEDSNNGSKNNSSTNNLISQLVGKVEKADSSDVAIKRMIFWLSEPYRQKIKLVHHFQITLQSKSHVYLIKERLI